MPMSATSESATNGAAPPPPPDVLVFTDAAAGKVGELIREEANPNLKLRVFVSGGGCSGFQYGFTFDEKMEEGDFCVEKQGVQLLIDPMSAQHLIFDLNAVAWVKKFVGMENVIFYNFRLRMERPLFLERFCFVCID